jgi:plastocyanin
MKYFSLKYLLASVLLLSGVVLLGVGCANNGPSEQNGPVAPPTVTGPTTPPPATSQSGGEELPVAGEPEIAETEGEEPQLEPGDEQGVQPDSEPEELPDSDESADEPIVAEPVVKEIMLEAKQWEFVPAVVTVNEGDRVRLTVTSTDVAHGIGISAFGVNEQFEAGETVTVEFTADKKGTFPIMCTVFCGSGHGSMRASLIVQ